MLLVTFLMFSSTKVESTQANEPTGVEGIISISPSRPGPTRIGEPGSKPLPNAEFIVQNEKGPVTSFTTDAKGSFKVALPPGHYTISSNTGKRRIGRFGPFEVDVVAGKMTKVAWVCDSGMR